MNRSERNRLREDLQRTVRELSDTYEELTLLYQLSEDLAGLGVDEICEKLLKEVQILFDAETVAILLLNEKERHLYTKASTGNWNPDRIIPRGNRKSIFWRPLLKKKAITLCVTSSEKEHNELAGLGSVLIAPLTGKKKEIGLILAANRRKRDEFFAGDVKLLRSLAFQAGLFMENAILSREVQSFLIGIIRSFVRALEASSEWTAGHTERVTGYAVAVGRLLGFSPAQIERLRICSLLHDIGKIATPDEILNKGERLSEEEWEKIRQHPVIGAEILSELRGFIDVVDCIRYHHERYDGKGLHGLKGDDIPLKARILAVCDAFDAMTSDRPYRRRLSAEEAIEEIEKESGRQFDPEIAEVFSGWIRSAYGIEPPQPEPDA